MQHPGRTAGQRVWSLRMFSLWLLLLLTRLVSGGYLVEISDLTTGNCGGDIVVESPNYLTSPGYPTTYPPSQQCAWVLSNPGQKILAEFNVYFELVGDDCEHDYVEVRDGGDETSPLLGRFCGKVAPPRIVSNGDKLFIKFVTDNETGGAGFSLQYERSRESVKCGGNLTIEPLGHLTSLTSQHCVWALTTPEPDQKIVISLKMHFSVNDRHCKQEYLEVYDGGSEQSPLLGRFCMANSPHPLISSGNKVIVKFVSDTSLGTTFELTYRIQEKVDCGGNITIEPLGQLTSEGYPFVYRPNQHCVWVLTAPEPQYKIDIKFNTSYFIMHPYCNKGYVEVFDGGDETSPSLGKFCGFGIPSRIISSGDKLLIKFVTGNETGEGGFSLQYDVLKKHVNCGGNIEVDSPSYLTSPGYPRTMPPSQHCVWVLTAPRFEQKIILNFNEMFHVAGTDCKYDYVEVYDGGDGMSRLLGRFCGTVAPPQLVSSGNKVLIKFVTDNETEGVGFSLQTSKKLFNCGSNIKVATPSYLASPGFPMSYLPSRECVWVLTAPESDQKIVINFNSYFDLIGTDCKQDYLEIYDGGDEESPFLGRFCGKVAPPEIISRGNNVLIKFVTDKEKEGGGFAFTYKIKEKDVDCSRNFTAPAGVITVPDLPRTRLGKVYCTFMIFAPNKSDIVVDFDMDRNPYYCVYDLMEIWDGFPSVGSPIEKYCDRETSSRVTAVSGVLSMTVNANVAFGIRRFSATYTIGGTSLPNQEE